MRESARNVRRLNCVRLGRLPDLGPKAPNKKQSLRL